MGKDAATTRLGDLRRMAADRKRDTEEEASENYKRPVKNQGLSDESLDNALKAMMQGDPSKYVGFRLSSIGRHLFLRQIEQVKPLMKSLGLSEEDLNEDKLKEMMSPVKICHRTILFSIKFSSGKNTRNVPADAEKFRYAWR